MPSKEQAHAPKDGRTSKRRSSSPQAGPDSLKQPSPAALAAPASLAPDELLQLQRTIGNQAVGRLLAGNNRSSSLAQPIQVRATVAVPFLQREWNLDTYQKENLDGYNELLTLVGWTGAKGKPKTRARGRLLEFAQKTDSPQQLKGMLQKVGSHTVLGTLLESATPAQIEKLIAVIPKGEELQQLLTTVGGADNLTNYYSTITTDETELYKLLKLETDLTILTQLKATITSTATLILVLENTPDSDTGRGTFLQQTIQKAGSWQQLRILARYSQKIGILRQLLDLVPVQKLKNLAEIQEGALIKNKGAGVLELLNYTNFDTAADLIQNNPNASLDQWKFWATQRQLDIKAPGPVVHPMAIRFTQAAVTNSGEGYTVRDNIAKLKREPDWHIPAAPIRVFIKTKAMNNKVKEGRTEFGYASPTYLEDGETYSLDNRRLYAYQQAGRDAMPAPQFVPLNVVQKEWYKFTTKDGGRTAQLS